MNIATYELFCNLKFNSIFLLWTVCWQAADGNSIEKQQNLIKIVVKQISICLKKKLLCFDRKAVKIINGLRHCRCRWMWLFHKNCLCHLFPTLPQKPHLLIRDTYKPYWLNYWHTLISKDTSGFTSNTLYISY